MSNQSLINKINKLNEIRHSDKARTKNLHLFSDEFIDYLKHFGYDASFEQEAGANGYNTCFSQEYGGVEHLINIGEIARRGYLIISWKGEV